MKTFLRKIKNIFTIPDTFDEDDRRMRQIINGILIAIMIIAALSIALVFAYGGTFQENITAPVNTPTLRGSIAGLVGSIGLFFLNRRERSPKNLVGALLVAFAALTTCFSDTPQQLTGGISFVFWTIPILLSVVVLPPVTVFITDAVVFIEIIILSGSWDNLSIWNLFGLFLISMIAWIGMEIANHALVAARAEAKKNLSIIERIAEGIVVVDQAGNISIANLSAKVLLGSELTSIAKAGTDQDDQVVGEQHLSIKWNNIPKVGRVAVIRNITREREVENAKDAILGIVSHELRTPLSSILAAADMILVTPTITEDMVKRIRSNITRMTVMINDLLDQAKMQAGAMRLNHEPFSIKPIFNTISEIVEINEKSKELSVSLHLGDGLPEQMVGDKNRVLQIITNLTNNAMKFTDAGGTVDISLDRNDDKTWKITVQDTGGGIPAEQRPDLFKPFKRGSDYMTRRYQGAGLGLSIAKQLVDLMGGSVSYETAVGKGTAFTVILPLEAP